MSDFLSILSKKYLNLGLIVVVVLGSASCGAESNDAVVGEGVEQSASQVSGSSERCDYWGLYATTAHGNFEAQKLAEVTDPMGNTKKTVDYDNAEDGSPAKIYLDEVLQAIEAGLPVEEVRARAVDVCMRFTSDQLDPANFYSAQ